MGYSFKNGVVYDGSTKLGNIKGDCIYQGNYSTPGNGKVVGNIKNDCIYEGSSRTPGSGTAVGNVKNGYVYSSHSRAAGSGTKKCKVSDVTISGIQHESDAMIAAVYHLLCKKFL